VDLENAADFMATEGITVANQSLSWTGQSYADDTGPITTIVNESRDDDGVFWAVSAGNHAEGHWRGGWLDDDADSTLEFDGTDEGMGLDGEFDVTVVLSWDQYDNPETDLDLYLYASDGTEVMSSVYPQGPWYGPVEAVWATYDGGQAPYHVVVKHESGPTASLDMTLVSYYNDLEHQVASSSIGEPGDAHGAFTVGAVNRGDWNNPSIAGYSGQGPTNDGRDKPDIVAPDGTDCATYGEAYGTSMSSPTLAGAAALLLEADPSMTPEMVGHALRVMAEDAGDAGYDHVFGAGLLDLPLEPCIDGDADGYGSGAFGNAHCDIADVDCDDTEATTYPGATDDWYDGVDSDCGGEADYDADGDGHDSDAYGGGDCDDTDPALNPDADDPWYDGQDTNCDGADDFDADADGFTSDQYEGEDCDDEDADVHPDAAEDCTDELDNDCDGLVDLDDDECDPGDDDDSAAGDDDDTTAGDDDDTAIDDDDGEPLDDDDDGGCECSTTTGSGPSPLLILGILAPLFLRRRKKRDAHKFIRNSVRPDAVRNGPADKNL